MCPFVGKKSKDDEDVQESDEIDEEEYLDEDDDDDDDDEDDLMISLPISHSLAEALYENWESFSLSRILEYLDNLPKGEVEGDPDLAAIYKSLIDLAKFEMTIKAMVKRVIDAYIASR